MLGLFYHPLDDRFGMTASGRRLLPSSSGSPRYSDVPGTESQSGEGNGIFGLGG